jgi:hypothetical protein
LWSERRPVDERELYAGEVKEACDFGRHGRDFDLDVVVAGRPDRALERDWAQLTAFYDFPAEHWRHLRTTNPIESSFATRPEDATLYLHPSHRRGRRRVPRGERGSESV